MENNLEKPIQETSQQAEAGQEQPEPKWYKLAAAAIKKPFHYTVEFVFFIGLFSYFLDNISVLPIIASLVGIGVPYLMGFTLLSYIFLGLIIFRKKWFVVTKERALFFLATSFIGLVSAITLWLFFKDDIAPLKLIQIYASALNYAVVFGYTLLILFVSLGFSINKHVESIFLTLVSCLVIGFSFMLFNMGITYSQYAYYQAYIVACGVVFILGAKAGIYLCIREEINKKESGTAINSVRLKARESKYNEVFFAAIGLIMVVPIFIVLAWAAYESDFNTVQFICYEVDSFPSSFGQFKDECSSLTNSN